MPNNKTPASRAGGTGAQREARSSTSSKKQNSSASSDIQILDAPLSGISRPLSLIDGRAYAVGALPIIKGGKRSHLGIVVRDDAAVFSVGSVKHPTITGSLEHIGIQWECEALPMYEGLSAVGIKRFQGGYRPDLQNVFLGVFGVIDAHVDFNKSLSDQRTMCELTTCYAISTYFTSAFDVVGYLWITGAPGSGKTQLLATVSELAFLGRTVLGASSYAATRDAASWEATIAFDDSEMIEEPSKRELILAGSRRGAKVTIKRKSGKDEWQSVEIDIFCPRLFSAIQRPDHTLGSRCITIPMVRSAESGSTRTPIPAQGGQQSGDCGQQVMAA